MLLRSGLRSLGRQYKSLHRNKVYKYALAERIGQSVCLGVRDYSSSSSSSSSPSSSSSSSPSSSPSSSVLTPSDAVADQWLDAAVEWLKLDHNPQTRDEIQSLITDNDTEGLKGLLGERLTFGTAGLRGIMGAGYNRMNNLVILQTAQGLCKYLEQTFGQDVVRARGITVGYDHRASGNLNSQGFAEITARVFLSRGIPVHMLHNQVATPLVAYGVRHTNSVAGVMVTASHNPKEDNGFKVYWENGAQIISPHDTGIAAAIENNLSPWVENYDDAIPNVGQHELHKDAVAAVANSYFATLREKLHYQRHGDEASAYSDLKIVYSAMHGVGSQWVTRAMDQFGIRNWHFVKRQRHPDPDFPTVSFPNPEEGKGALQLSMETADDIGADIILANDPDADRLAVAERIPEHYQTCDQGDDSSGSNWRLFTGNEIGTLLGHWQWLKNKDNSDPNRPDIMLASTVSSKMLRAMAEKEGFRFEETLTGFKWMGNRAQQLEQQENARILFAYEEAIGFCVGDLVRDKDGVAAAAVFSEFANEVYAEGSTVQDYYKKLCDTYGHFVSCNHYYRASEKALQDSIFDVIRGPDNLYLPSIAGFKVDAVRDLGIGFDSSKPEQKAVLPPESMITFTLENGCVVTVRNSGTEPKVKFYVELPGQVGQSRSEVEDAVANIAQAVVTDILQPERFKLEQPIDSPIPRQ